MYNFKVCLNSALSALVLLFSLVASGQQQTDPQKFNFENSVTEPAKVTSSQPSTATYGNHPRGTDDPVFLAQELLGRPTDSAITVNAVAREDVEAYYEYGTKSGLYPTRTEDFSLPADESVHVLIDGLQPNTRYYYRMQYKDKDADSFKPRNEYSFHTQRAPGSTFTFVVEADPHMLSNNHPEAYKLSLNKMLADQPDFMLDLGDTFFIDRYRRTGTVTKDQVTGRVQLLRSYFDIINHSVPLFLVNGNHEGEWGRLLDGTRKSMPVLGTLGRKEYFPNPEPNGFYTGATKMEDFIGLRQANYAWEWGDALFIALDPYWNQPVSPEQSGDWSLTLGRQQYDWLKETLENSDAEFTFLFAHNLIGGLNMKGSMRGGVEVVKYLEMGGYNLDGSWGFDEARPGWEMPIHQLLAKHNATIYFKGHDHLYVHQELDGVTYQTTPVPAVRGLTDKTSSAKTYNYNTGTVVNGGGYLRVTVSPEEVTVDYVQTYMPHEEDETHKDGMIGHSYTIKAKSDETAGILDSWQ